MWAQRFVWATNGYTQKGEDNFTNYTDEVHVSKHKFCSDEDLVKEILR